MRERSWRGDVEEYDDGEEYDGEQDDDSEFTDGHEFLQGIEEDSASGWEEQCGSEVSAPADATVGRKPYCLGAEELGVG